MIEIDEGVRRPEFAAQFLSCNEFSRMFKQRGQYLQGLFLKFYLLTPLAQLSRIKIYLKRAEADDSW